MFVVPLMFGDFYVEKNLNFQKKWLNLTDNLEGTPFIITDALRE